MTPAVERVMVWTGVVLALCLIAWYVGYNLRQIDGILLTRFPTPPVLR